MKPFDYVVLACFFTVSITLGLRYRAAGGSVQHLFRTEAGLGGVFEKGIVGLSLAASFFSGISFLMYPSMVQQFGLAVLCATAVVPLTWLFLRYWFWPRFFRTDPSSPFGTVERAYGPAAKRLHCALYVAYRLCWMATLIYAPTRMVLWTDASRQTYAVPLILAIGGICTLFSVRGGLRSVIVTEAFQFGVILAGISAVVLFGWLRFPGDFAGGAMAALAREETTKISFSLDPYVTLTIWSLLAGFLVPNIASFAADPIAIQRYLGLGGTTAASRTYFFNGVGSISVITLLVGVGFIVMVWRLQTTVLAKFTDSEQYFPAFVALVLPSGFLGLMIAALLAATMNCLSSGINGMSAMVVQDLIETPTDRWWASPKAVSLWVGCTATIAACFIGQLGSIFDITRKLLGVISGPLLVTMCASVGGLQVPGFWVIVSQLAGLVAGWTVAFSGVSSLWAAPTALLITLILMASGSRSGKTVNWQTITT